MTMKPEHRTELKEMILAGLEDRDQSFYEFEHAQRRVSGSEYAFVTLMLSDLVPQDESLAWFYLRPFASLYRQTLVS